MKISSLLSAIALIPFAAAAGAHARLQQSVPPADSVVTSSPANLVLNFSEAAQLTALTIQKGNDPPQRLKPPASGAATQILVPLPQLAPGAYTISWRVLSADGHVMSGALHFTLSAEHAADHAG